jgi:NADPH:quinone reductase-like Zn-dependent oxidoreductase
VREYGIPEDHIFSSRDLTFVQGIMRVTNGKGIDVVLNSLSGEVGPPSILLSVEALY